MADIDISGEKSASQTVKAQLELREILLTGSLRPGERLTETSMAERLNVSRTPIRAALSRLAEEGLLDALPSGGYAVKSFTREEVIESIEIRGTLEGLAARLAAERGVSAASLRPIHRCLDDIDAVIGSAISPDSFSDYVRLNARFHDLLQHLCGSRALVRQIERSLSLPFASPSAFVMAQSAIPQAASVLAIAQDQHRCVVHAIERRESARAEALMREHARLAVRNLDYAIANDRAFRLVPGAALIDTRQSA